MTLTDSRILSFERNTYFTPSIPTGIPPEDHTTAKDTSIRQAEQDLDKTLVFPPDIMAKHSGQT